MSLLKFGVPSTKGRLAKSAAFSALALSTLAGSVMLSGGDAQAACGDPLPTTCDVLDPTFTPSTHRKFAAVIDRSELPTTALISLEWTGSIYPNSQVEIVTDFLNAPITGAPRTARYTVGDLTPGFGIDGFDLGFLGMNPVSGVNPRVIKEIFDNDAFSGTPILTLIQDGPGFTAVTDVPRRSQYWIRDTFIPGDGNINESTNTVRNVPGPLPILGAGAAFGFSRKLRGRIKATSAV
ncbi:MAG: hypothetical protein VKO26_00040 [Cyanobacteriota bacterium]|nr:hypothetical protein [Cyanobacteriota bacterium]